MSDSLAFTAPWFRQTFLDQNGNPLSGGSVYFYSAGSTVKKNIWLDLTKTNKAPNPMPLNSSGVPSNQYYFESGLYDIGIYNSNNELIQTLYNIETSGGSGTVEVDSYKVMVDSIDPTPGYLFDKVIAGPFMTVSKTAGSVGEAIELAFQPVVSATGSDVPGYLINKLSSLNTPIGIESYNGKVNLTFDYSKVSANLTNSPYAVWWSNSNGNLVGTNAFTFGDPSRLGALYTPSLQVMSSMVMGNNAGFWDDSNFTMNHPAIGGTVQLTPGYSNTKYIYAHNNENNASVVTDKASFANLANNGLVFASMWPNSSEDAIYLHTATGLSYSPTTNILTAPNLAVTTTLTLSALTTAGILVNDASGNISSVPVSTFADDHLVLVDSLDTTPGYLGTKLAAGTNIGFNVTTDSHGSKLWISARSNMLLNPTYVTANYTVVDSDMCVVSQTNDNVTISLPTPGRTYNGRGLYVYGCGTGVVTINTVSGGIRGYTPTISGYGKLMFRCLKSSDNNYYWICGA